MLFPARADALELRWRFAHANRAQQAVLPGQGLGLCSPSVRLNRFCNPQEGAESLGAYPVASAKAGAIGFAHLRPDAWYQAELGLVTPDGGWLMLARSNELALPGVAGGDSRARAAVAPKTSDPVAVVQQGALAPSAVPATIWAILQASGQSRTDRADGPPDSSDLGRLVLDALGTRAQGGPPATGQRQGQDARERVSLGLEARNPPWETDQSLAEDGRVLSPQAGSGPVVSPRQEAQVLLWGELRVGGRAPPGSVLDLGGHAYRVGSGGRFAFDLKLTRPELIHALLALLPELPVAERDGD